MDRKYSDPTIWDNSIDHDDEPDGSDGGYTKHGSFIVAPAMRELVRLRAELAECKRDAERYCTALEQIVAPFEDLNFVSGNKPLTYIYYVATDALAAKGE